MDSLSTVPEWLGAAAAGAMVAALGYVAKMVIQGISAFRAVRNTRQAALVQLQSLLRVAHVSFTIQNDLVKRLLTAIQRNHPNVPIDSGYESAISVAHGQLSKEEKELHNVIRGYTTNALQPTNLQILNWVRSDSYFRAQRSKKSVKGEFARNLGDLEAHLLLWQAKYEAWIPNQPHHALVYLADEKQHGLGFPREIDNTVEKLLQ